LEKFSESTEENVSASSEEAVLNAFAPHILETSMATDESAIPNYTTQSTQKHCTHMFLQ